MVVMALGRLLETIPMLMFRLWKHVSALPVCGWTPLCSVTRNTGRSVLGRCLLLAYVLGRHLMVTRCSFRFTSVVVLLGRPVLRTCLGVFRNMALAVVVVDLFLRVR